MAQNEGRPISPHLSIWRWGPHMLTSIVHRVTGDGLAVVGGIGFVWWLLSIAGGAESYGFFQSHATAWYGLALKIALTWAFFQHLCSGVRHLIMDVGAGYELKANRTGSIFVFVTAILLTAALWGYLFYGKV